MTVLGDISANLDKCVEADSGLQNSPVEGHFRIHRQICGGRSMFSLMEVNNLGKKM